MTTIAAFGDKIMVRIAESGEPWLMNQPEKGWGSYGFEVTWEYLAAQRENWRISNKLESDKHSAFFWLERI